MAAKKDIIPMQAFLYVPTNLVISVHNLRKRSPSLALIFDKHPEIFKTHRDAEYNTMVIYVMHEMQLKEKSFWHPYFEIISRPDLPMMWEDDDLSEF